MVNKSEFYKTYIILSGHVR